MAGNFLQQENVVLTGACEAIVVDVQCIFPALGPLSKCFHTKFITTSPIAQMPDSDYIRFDVGTAAEKAKQIVMTACENFKNRKPDLVYIPDMKMCIRDSFEEEPFSSRGFLNRKAIREHAEELIEKFDVRPRGCAEAPAGTPVSYTHLDVYKRQDLRMQEIRNMMEEGEM